MGGVFRAGVNHLFVYCEVVSLRWYKVFRWVSIYACNSFTLNLRCSWVFFQGLVIVKRNFWNCFVGNTINLLVLIFCYVVILSCLSYSHNPLTLIGWKSLFSHKMDIWLKSWRSWLESWVVLIWIISFHDFPILNSGNMIWIIIQFDSNHEHFFCKVSSILEIWFKSWFSVIQMTWLESWFESRIKYFSVFVTLLDYSHLLTWFIFYAFDSNQIVIFTLFKILVSHL